MEAYRRNLILTRRGINSLPVLTIALACWAMCLLLVLAACGVEGQTDVAATATQTPPDRSAAIPAGAIKYSPAQDGHPPVLHSDAFLNPRPLEGPINTAGAEDSPFIAPDGQSFFFFFTPDVRVPVEQQLLDGVTGIYLSQKVGDGWSEPIRVVLQDPDKLALDGCEFFDGNSLWFCSARQGYTGLHWFSSRRVNGGWSEPEFVDFNPDYEVGELHIHGDLLYFHSSRAGGKGDLDLWVSQKVDGSWQPPVNLEALNSEVLDGYPFVSADGQELWFTRWHQGTPAIYRSTREGSGWSAATLIVSQFAGEPTLDPEGNLYFVHHFYRDGEMLEADIYVAERK